MDTPSDPKNENMKDDAQAPVTPAGTSPVVNMSSENAMSKPEENIGAASEPTSDQGETTGSMTTEGSPAASEAATSSSTGGVGSENSMPQNPAAIPAVPDAEKMSTDTTQAPAGHKGGSKLIIVGIVIFVLVLAGVIVYLGNQMRVGQAKQAARVVSTQSLVTPTVAPTQAPSVKATDPVSDPSEDLNSLNQDLNQL